MLQQLLSQPQVRARPRRRARRHASSGGPMVCLFFTAGSTSSCPFRAACESALLLSFSACVTVTLFALC
eukprot:4259820-Prymnesium_polylepis.1